MQYCNNREDSFGGIKYVAKILDDFGQAGGFDNILAFFDRVASGEEKTCVEHIGNLMTFLSGSLMYWTREFMSRNMETIVEKFLAMMRTEKASNPLNMAFTKGHLNILIN